MPSSHSSRLPACACASVGQLLSVCRTLGSASRNLLGKGLKALDAICELTYRLEPPKAALCSSGCSDAPGTVGNVRP
eukprot:15432790-Alexandrium_andersonii.AAC.1